MLSFILTPMPTNSGKNLNELLRPKEANLFNLYNN